jgi:hypothetical protein
MTYWQSVVVSILMADLLGAGVGLAIYLTRRTK